jgi:hypothetical protein
MTSKYDIYWQDHLDAILALFGQARTAGTSASLPLTGLDALGERGSWYGKLEIVNGQEQRQRAAEHPTVRHRGRAAEPVHNQLE